MAEPISEQASGQVPAGFRRVPEGLGFTDVVQPSYLRIEDKQVSFGFLASASHANSMGIVHGGVIMTLADLAAACGLNVARGEKAGSPTVNLSVDFISAGRIGEWLQADVEHVEVKRRFGFASGVIRNGGGLVARFNGTFYLPDHQGMWQDGEQRATILDHLGY